MTVGLLLVAAVAIMLLGVIVLMRQPKSARSFTFFLATFFAGLWSLGLAAVMTAQDPELVKLITKIHYTASASTICVFTLFAFAYAHTKITPGLVLAVIAPVIIFTLIIIVAPGTFLSNLEIGANGLGDSVEINPLAYSIYALSFIMYFFTSIIVLLRGRRKVQTPDSRNRIDYIVAAFALAGIVGMYFNLILPWMGNYSLIWVGPLGLFVFVGFVYAAMARYHLFDVRTVVVRVAMYAFIVTISGIAYAIVFYFMTTYIFGLENVSSLYYVINIFIMACIVIFAPILIRAAEQLVERWFLRDNYDSEELTSCIYEAAVQRHDPRDMLLTCAREIAKTLSVSYVQIVFEPNKEDEKLIVGTRTKNINTSDEVMLWNVAKTKTESVIVADDVESDSVLTSLFRRYNIAAFVTIDYSSVNTESARGYMLLGPKRHKGLFVKKDKIVLADIANILVIAVESARYYQRIQSFNETLHQRVREATAELKTTNRRLQKLDEAKDDFISMASHQLRTPLTSVRGYLSMVLDGDLGKVTADQRRVLSEAYVSSERMAFLIGDFLDVSRIQTGKFELQKTKTSLDKVLNGEISQLTLTAKSHDIEIKYTPPADLPKIMCDKNKLRQAMMNMIDNAIFYSPAGSSVEIALFQSRGSIFFTVKDHGIGVPRSEQMKLFGKFYRGSNARKIRPDGTGIGLYMARKAVLSHGGSVIFESKENVGSTFGFRIPIN